MEATRTRQRRSSILAITSAASRRLRKSKRTLPDPLLKALLRRETASRSQSVRRSPQWMLLPTHHRRARRARRRRRDVRTIVARIIASPRSQRPFRRRKTTTTSPWPPQCRLSPPSRPCRPCRPCRRSPTPICLCASDSSVTWAVRSTPAPSAWT